VNHAAYHSVLTIFGTSHPFAPEPAITRRGPYRRLRHQLAKGMRRSL